MSAFSVKMIGVLDFRVYRNAAADRMGSNNLTLRISRGSIAGLDTGKFTTHDAMLITSSITVSD